MNKNIKNPGTKQAKAARALQADCRIALTGTPVENNVGELWSIMEFINSGFLYTQAEFKRQFFIPIQVHRSPEAAERLRQITRPFILRRLKQIRRSLMTCLKSRRRTYSPSSQKSRALYIELS